jgi:hypothetical protein
MTESPQQPPVAEPSTRRRKAWLIAGGVLALAVLAYLATQLHDAQPDYYQPARTALVTAKQRFAVSYSEENDLLANLHQTHQDLQSVIETLDKAGVEPAYRNELEQLRERLRRMMDMQHLEQIDSQQLNAEYAAIEAEFDVLIKKLSHPNSAQ